VEWLSEDTFASAGADMRIFIMRVDEDESIKTLK
jgi:transducin (beta)-like 1